MDVLKTKVIEKVSTKLSEIPIATVEDIVSRAEEYFKAKTKRREVPERAFWLWVDLSIAMHKSSLNEGEAVVSSIKRGDTTINYGATKVRTVSSFDEELKGYKVVVSR
ncbi:MAG: hypothetical protein VB130_04045 [Clostridium sp.]|nr:hypothetical protein [Clostridium sp.]